ncbi:MAG: 50S ribosome-binding GTPase [Candidatus Lokiarchaeota archaeon]|nr:50S ribosome-binding GTPase [Candidatus Lokiarchaeota archaeon]
MSSNIGPEASAAYDRYLDAKNIDDKIRSLEEFLSVVPKHKATEKIVALNKSRLSKLKREQEDKKEREKAGKKTSPFSIKREGIQIILVSDYHMPGVGKTSILNLLTGAAKKKIGKFTPLPEIGIYKEQKIKFQIVDMPSIMIGASNGVGNGKEILSQIRSCDLIVICIDLSRNVDDQIRMIEKELNESNIRLNMLPPPISIEKTGANKIQVFYLTKEAKNVEELSELSEKIKEIVNAAGLRNGIVKIYGRISLDQIVDALNPSVVYKKVLLLGTKGDLPHTQESFEDLKERYLDKYPAILGSSSKKREFSPEFGKIVLDFLKKIKVFTSHKGVVAEKPLILDSKVRIRNVAIKIHRSFYEKFDYAIVIREGARQYRKKVGLDYEIEDNDIIELFTI